MANIVATNGLEYPLWGPSQKCWVREASETISYSEFENELGDGFYSSVLYGSSAGNRSWSLTLPSLKGTSADAIYEGPDGGLLTPLDYVWDLFRYCKATGKPFVLQDPVSDQYYFVRFADKELTRQRILTKLYSAGLNIKQARIPGASVFDPGNIQQLWGHYDANNFTGTAWPDETGRGHDLPTVTGDIQHVANAKNGQHIIRFNNTTGSGYISSTLDVTVYDFIAVIRIDEDTFSNYGGVCTGDTSGTVLVGDNATTRFFYFAENSPQQYWKNNVPLETTNDQQAPMNVFGIVHARFKNGVSLPNIQLGKDRSSTGRYAKMSLGDVGISDSHIPMSTVWEFIEHLSAKYRVNVIGQ